MFAIPELKLCIETLEWAVKVITVDSAAGTLGTSVTVDTAVSLSQLADNINRQAGGVDATIGQDGNLILSNQNGAAIAISGVTANTGLSAGTYTGFLGLTSGNGADIKIGTLATNDPSALTAFGLNMGTGNGSVTPGGSNDELFRYGSVGEPIQPRRDGSVALINWRFVIALYNLSSR
ncbi:MAG: hypothetical protein M0Q44_06805 [Methylobacter sp.]|nr:hypothetical protein [Methylobacter sp.]